MLTTRTIILGFLIALSWCRASDHADPIDLEPMLSRAFKETPREAGITDLHVFLDSDQDPSLQGRPEAVVISFCVGRSLPPLAEADSRNQSPTIPTYPPDPSSRLLIPRLALQPDQPDRTRPLTPSAFTYRIFIDTDSPLAFNSLADSERYGGTILQPSAIAEDITLEVKLGDDLRIQDLRFSGLIGFNSANWRDTVALSEPYSSATRHKIHARSGIFDDPFIFPRFFRTNVIGIVIQIPLRYFDPRRANWLVWGGTWMGKQQIDHVGRSQRTQLPRFDLLNTIHPSQHVDALNRLHEDPTIKEDIRRTFIGPLFARRHYDAVPDVMIFRRDHPTGFPNGRRLDDDVAGLIARTGDTQLFETSYADSTEYPRATMNDGYFKRLPDGELDLSSGKPEQLQHKVFSTRFPYLAPPWTRAEAAQHPVPPPSRARLQSSTRRKLALLGATGLALAASALAGSWWLGYRTGTYRHHPYIAAGFSAPQGMSNEDIGPGSTYSELHNAVIAPANNRQYYGVWGDPATPSAELPRYTVGFWTVAKGLWPLGMPWTLGRATRRTLLSKADLRWGPQRTGFQRLIHPNGVCLAGEWSIDADSTGYTGFFKEGSRGLVIARLSPGDAETRRNHGWRSLGLIGKLFPHCEEGDTRCRSHAAFVVQEDLGGTRSQAINDSILLNAPDVSSWRRGKGIFSLFLSGLIFARVNINATVRQLYEIAELGKPTGEPTRSPRCMRLRVTGDRRSVGTGLDVREEVLDHIYDRGDPIPRRRLEFSIEVSDADPMVFKNRVFDAFIRRNLPETSWKPIGRLSFKEAACSYNGDFVIHFRHPKWRSRPDDPASVADVR